MPSWREWLFSDVVVARSSPFLSPFSGALFDVALPLRFVIDPEVVVARVQYPESSEIWDDEAEGV